MATTLSILISATSGCLICQRLALAVVSGQLLQKPRMKSSGVCVVSCTAFRGSDRFTAIVLIRQRQVEFELMQNSGIGPLASTGFLPVERRERITIAALFLIRDSCAPQCYETIIFRDASAAMNCDGAVQELNAL